MHHRYPISRVLAFALAGAASLLGASRAGAQSPVTFATPTTAQFRAVIASAVGDYVTIPCVITLELGAPANPGVGSVVVRAMHIAPSNFQCTVPLQGTPTAVFVSGLVVDAAPGAGVLLPAQPGTPGETLFAGTGIAESAAGSINYNAVGLACQTVQNSGGQCSGPFNLATPGSNSGGIFASGSIAPGAGNQPRAVAFQFRGSFPFVANTTWGRIDVLANLTGTIPGGAPACPADFNGVGGLNVQDIFDFLAAWFAGSAQADFNHADGIGVQDIFDFLGAWFAGC